MYFQTKDADLFSKYCCDHEALECAGCQREVVTPQGGLKIRIREAPSQNMEELVDMWKCCEHEDANYAEVLTRSSPKGMTSLMHFNVLTMPQGEDLTHATTTDEDGQICCSHCGSHLGFSTASTGSFLYLSRILAPSKTAEVTESDKQH